MVVFQARIKKDVPKMVEHLHTCEWLLMLVSRSDNLGTKYESMHAEEDLSLFSINHPHCGGEAPCIHRIQTVPSWQSLHSTKVADSCLASAKNHW